MITKSKLSNINLSETIINSMPGMVYIFDKEGRLILWNKRATDVYGYTDEEMQNKPLLDFVDKADHERLMTTFNNALTEGFDQLENTAITKEGKKIPYLGSATAINIMGEPFIIGLGVDISELHSARLQIKSQLEEISKLNELLKAENIYLRGQLELSGDQHSIIGESEPIKYLLFKIKQVGPTDASVLIQGETGTGKELVARAIHEESTRKNEAFVKVNCASIPENLIESELFGHEKGAFTGAIEKRIGRFELADGGTIFLDEVGELPINLQSKLLNILQHGEFERLGSSKTIRINVRIIAATNRVLEEEIKKGKFRKDLYYRLNVFPISIAPLSERKSDIPLLVEYYTKYYSEKMNKPIKAIPKTAIKRMMDYEWPGNVRELENVIDRAVITTQGSSLRIEQLPKSKNESEENLTFEEHEKNFILKTLERTNWKINGSHGAAEILKVNPQTLRSKILKLGIKKI